ncbi:MAG: vWFA-like protein with metal ion dependent adhesion motif (MIDAS) [Pseudolabrys sp.]|jgi:hypothetical protein|nr:vWFA-like protein with metal ion dependent adhesion motif (MIDAS) [Pseudolabrys sp.]
MARWPKARGGPAIALLAVAAAIAVAAAGDGLAAPSQRLADARPGAIPVDVELVLAVDISYSMDPEEQALQREGYMQALTSKEFLSALREGANGKIAVTYVEWAGAEDQTVVMPWRLIDGLEAAGAVVEELQRTPPRRGSRTSIAGALRFSRTLFDTSGYRGLRRVIDVSGDGPNNAGPLVTQIRDDVLASGIVINGLPIMLNRNRFMDIPNLDVYYEDCVTGGAGSFVVPIRDRAQFIDATRKKLILEVAGREPAPRVIRASAEKPRISCTIGEKMWQDRWGGTDFR